MKELRLTTHEGRALSLFVGPTNCVQVEEAGASQKWHGIRSNVRVDNGKWFEVREDAAQIARMLGA